MKNLTTQRYLQSLDVNEKILSSVDSGIIILDDEMNVHYYNRWLEIRTKLKEEDVLNRRLSDVFTNVNAQTLTEKINKTLELDAPTFYTANASKYLIPIKIDQKNVSNSTHMLQDVSVTPFDKENKLVLLIITDQTDTTNVNELLETNALKVQELNAELLKERETIDEKILLIKFNPQRVITDVSHAYLNLLEYEKEEILGRDFFVHESFSIDPELKAQITQSVNEKKVFKFENRVLTLNNEELTLSNTLVTEYDAYGEHVGFILFMENATNAKKVIEQQEKLLSTSRSAAMGEMISMIAHQWRQPLSVINTVMATVRIKEELEILDSKSTEDAFTKIEETISFLSNTIDDFKDYFKPNKLIAEISLKATIDKAMSFLLAEIKLLNVGYELDVDENLLIETHENELIQCLINVIKNSIDAFGENARAHGAPKLLTISATKDVNVISLSLNDNAGGIKKEIINKIFEPYFSTKARNGTGLGLYMAKTIIEEHLKGKITTTSHDASTKTLIELPYAIKN